MKAKRLLIALLALALAMPMTNLEAKPTMQRLSAKAVIGGVLGFAVAGPAGLAAGGYLGYKDDQHDDRLTGVENVANLAHERLNRHDETFDALKDYYERQEGRATKEVQETRKTRALWPWEVGKQ
jgi:hypothetical protein